ncbi:hypothetical protein JCM10914A_53120 [Paenibacillus sp. JCM 10914]|uniref:hypothetical protein n=1 Tax=Paenibacillus sp. JCM 10914 TaxID=1236974 RepID=UPI0003CC34DF|nr:hypothetical protein [Paenibacillus sp. JCM 10914]GAE04965.1 hypothetical protein JCM10914_1042 [Paenibacillus sp. JCM 10914]
MTKLITAVLEILRMILIMMIAITVLGSIERGILKFWITWREEYNLLLLVANILLFFVFYRNRLQFTGFYRSSRTQKKLAKPVSQVLIISGIVLILMPLLVNWLST